MKKYQTIIVIVIIFNYFVFNTCSFSQGVAINNSGAAADPSAVLDLSSTNSGLLVPRMTTAQRNLISNVATGLQIFNVTTNCLEIYVPPMWQNIFCGCTPPSVPIAASHTPYQTEILWDWDDVSGAIGYQWNTTNTYPGVGVNTLANSFYSQSGLSCNTSYTLYIWAYNNCGHSSEVALTETTSACLFICGSIVNFTYNGSQVAYGTVSGNYNSGQYCWLDRNLGASVVATAYNHSNAYGDLFQWGRLDDGHQLRTSGTTSVQSTTVNPGHGLYVFGTGYTNWYIGTNPDPNTLWQGVNGINNPCPAGWRLPTETELNNERSSWSSQNYNGAFQSSLKLTAAGWHHPYSSIIGAGTEGGYWTSTVDAAQSKFLFFDNSLTCFSGCNGVNWYPHRSYGRSVRCILE